MIHAIPQLFPDVHWLCQLCCPTFLRKVGCVWFFYPIWMQEGVIFKRQLYSGKIKSGINGPFRMICSLQLSGQIIATSHDLTPNGGLVRDIPLFRGNLGSWNIIIWPELSRDDMIPCLNQCTPHKTNTEPQDWWFGSMYFFFFFGDEIFRFHMFVFRRTVCYFCSS